MSIKKRKPLLLTAEQLDALAGRLLRRGLNRIAPMRDQATQSDLRIGAKVLRELLPLAKEHLDGMVVLEN
jgi:hypothetical protein